MFTVRQQQQLDQLLLATSLCIIKLLLELLSLWCFTGFVDVFFSSSGFKLWGCWEFFMQNFLEQYIAIHAWFFLDDVMLMVIDNVILDDDAGKLMTCNLINLIKPICPFLFAIDTINCVALTALTSGCALWKRIAGCVPRAKINWLRVIQLQIQSVFFVTGPPLES